MGTASGLCFPNEVPTILSMVPTQEWHMPPGLNMFFLESSFKWVVWGMEPPRCGERKLVSRGLLRLGLPVPNS